MKSRVNHIWHDDWLLNNVLGFSSYKEATAAYKEKFGVDICVAALKNHCIFKLNIKKPKTNYRRITQEQADWLKDIYHKTGVRKTTEMWNARYEDNASCSCIKQIAAKLNLSVHSDIATANKLEAAHKKGSKRALRKPGDTRIECGRLVMKTEDGEWISAGRCVWEKKYGKIPKGYALVALDGDTANICLDNLEIVPWEYLGKLQRNGFFSSNPDITKAGIVWCDLETVLQKKSQLSQRL